MFIMSTLACQHVTQHNNISFSRGKSIRHQPRVRQGCCGEFGGHQTTNTLRAAASPPQAMGTERRQTRGTGQPTTGAAPKNLREPQQGVVSRPLGVSAHPGRARGGRPHATTGGEASAKPSQTLSWNSSASKNGVPMSNAIPSSASRNATAKSSARSCVP